MTNNNIGLYLVRYQFTTSNGGRFIILNDNLSLVYAQEKTSCYFLYMLNPVNPLDKLLFDGYWERKVDLL